MGCLGCSERPYETERIASWSLLFLQLFLPLPHDQGLLWREDAGTLSQRLCGGQRDRDWILAAAARRI